MNYALNLTSIMSFWLTVILPPFLLSSSYSPPVKLKRAELSEEPSIVERTFFMTLRVLSGSSNPNGDMLSFPLNNPALVKLVVAEFVGL